MTESNFKQSLALGAPLAAALAADAALAGPKTRIVPAHGTDVAARPAASPQPSIHNHA